MQNLASLGRPAPQLAQATRITAPHCKQNRAAAGFAWSHFGQGALLSCGPATPRIGSFPPRAKPR